MGKLHGSPLVKNLIFSDGLMNLVYEVSNTWLAGANTPFWLLSVGGYCWAMQSRNSTPRMEINDVSAKNYLVVLSRQYFDLVCEITGLGPYSCSCIVFQMHMHPPLQLLFSQQVFCIKLHPVLCIMSPTCSFPVKLTVVIQHVYFLGSHCINFSPICLFPPSLSVICHPHLISACSF